MKLRFSCATFIGLSAIAGTDAFMAPYVGKARHTAIWAGNDDFMSALSPGGDGEGDEEVSSGSDRFRAMKEAAEQAKQERELRPRAIDNPFLTPPAPANQPPVNSGEMSVEEQARMFREMMQQQQGGAAPTPAAPPVQRVAKTDRAGRPQGRNRDADQIANSADVYFAQLKRDSTVRTLARIRGDDDEADAVFEDEGIEELSNLLQTNPYLKAQREEEAKLIDAVPEEALKPYFDEKEDDNISSAGVKWKDMIKNRRKGKQPELASPSPPEPAAVSQPEPAALSQPEPVAPAEPEPVVAQVPEPVAVPEPEPVAPQPTAHQAAPAEVAQPQAPTAAVAASTAHALSKTPGDARQKVRTLMGFLLKHRGGPGFGTGRLKGPEIDRFENLLEEVTAVLRSEALSAAPTDAELTPVPATPQAVPAAVPAAPVAAAPAANVAAVPVAAASGAADLSQVDGIIACIEGANAMYKNSPPELKSSVLVALRAALMSAVSTCNSVLGNEMTLPPSGAAADMSQIDSTIACIEGAISMYKSSPAELKETVLVTLRAALLSAVNTCDAITSPGQPAPHQAAPVAPAAPQVVSVAPPQAQQPVVVEEAPAAPAVPATDANSQKLDRIYNTLQAAAGDGPLGLRSDLTSGEAAELEGRLMDMRAILMDELEVGIPSAGEAGTKIPDIEPAEAEIKESSSTVSKYQQMLAKAKAEKAKAASV